MAETRQHRTLRTTCQNFALNHHQRQQQAVPVAGADLNEAGVTKLADQLAGGAAAGIVDIWSWAESSQL